MIPAFSEQTARTVIVNLTAMENSTLISVQKIKTCFDCVFWKHSKLWKLAAYVFSEKVEKEKKTSKVQVSIKPNSAKLSK